MEYRHPLHSITLSHFYTVCVQWIPNTCKPDVNTLLYPSRDTVLTRVAPDEVSQVHDPSLHPWDALDDELSASCSTSDACLSVDVHLVLHGLLKWVQVCQRLGHKDFELHTEHVKHCIL